MDEMIPVVILAGGLGTRLEEETVNKPKPMVRIGGYPILAHIMSMYTKENFGNFYVSGGYRVEIIRRYFSDFESNHYNLDIHFLKDENRVGTTRLDTQQHKLDLFKKNWTVKVIDTGIESTTAGRIYNLREYLERHQYFLCTYGDGLSSLNVGEVFASHKRSAKLATVVAVHPPSRYGELEISKNGLVNNFSEKPISKAYINGGFLCFNREVLDLIDPGVSLEDGLLKELTTLGQLNAHIHDGYWQNMDTIREMKILENEFKSMNAPWI
jgi:glucose-1-phosphate cytidylyltransferase